MFCLATNQIAQTGLSSLPPVIYYSEQLFRPAGMGPPHFEQGIAPNAKHLEHSFCPLGASCNRRDRPQAWQQAWSALAHRGQTGSSKPRRCTRERWRETEPHRLHAFSSEKYLAHAMHTGPYSLISPSRYPSLPQRTQGLRFSQLEQIALGCLSGNRAISPH
ncbi:hypothetical protein EHZ61_06750 [Aeromonas caviae]|nr:hypothetical protein EHZ61_06750 [Aeromonas caviae]